jgi:hypothetical protein
MALTETRPLDPVNTGPNHTAQRPAHRLPPRQAPPQPHNEGRPIGPERNREELKIEPPLAEGLKRQQAELEANGEVKERELNSRFLEFQTEHEEQFQLAYSVLKRDEPGLNSYIFFQRFYRGLEIVSLLNPGLRELSVAVKLENILRPEPDHAGQTQANIEHLVRLGSVSLGGRTTADRRNVFLDLFLAVNFNRREALEPLVGKLSNEAGRVCLLAAANLVQGLYEKQLARIADTADQERLNRQVATKRRAERKEEEQLEQKRVESRREEATRLVGRIADKLEAAVLIRLGEELRQLQAEAEPSEQASLPAEELLQNIVCGLDQLDWLAKGLESILALPESKPGELLSLAYRWARLDSRLADLPKRLRDHIKGSFGEMLANRTLADGLLTDPATKSTLMLFDTKQNIGFLTAGFTLLASKEETASPATEPPFGAVDEIQPLPTLAAVGKICLSLKLAAEEKNAAAFVPPLLFCADGERFPIPFDGDLSYQQRLAIFSQAFIAAGPEVVPLLLSAYRSAAPELSQLEPEAGRTAGNVITYVIIDLCRKYPEALNKLLEAPDLNGPRQAETAQEQVIDIRHPKTVRLPQLEPWILKALFGIYNHKERDHDRVESTELPAGHTFAPAERLKLEVQRLTAENISIATAADQGTAAARKNILALAARIATTIDLVATGKPTEARTELSKLLAAAESAGIKLSYAQALVGYVYAGRPERATTDDLRELSAFCSGETNGPGSRTNLQRVLEVSEGKICTVSKDYQGLDGAALAAEFLLYGLVMTHERVAARRTLAARIISVLKGDEATWSSLMELVKSQPAEAAAFIDNFIREARKAAAESENERKLRLVKSLFDTEVLKQALTAVPKPRPVSG